MNDDLYSSPNQSVQTTNTVPNIDATVFDTGFFDIIGSFFFFLLGCAFFGLIVFWILKHIRKKKYLTKKSTTWKESVALEISVPKESAEQAQKEQSSKKTEQETISAGEQIFSILSEYSNGGFGRWMNGGERFSFEIVTINKEIRFWVICSKSKATVLEKQILAVYPRAHIERMKKLDFFHDNSFGFVQEMDLGSKYVLPFRTYKHMEHDPLNALTNSMSGLEMGESAAIQLVLSPIKENWQKKPRLAASKIQQGQSPEEVLFKKSNHFEGIFKFFQEGFKTLLKSDKDDKPDMSEKKRKIDLTGQEVELRLTPQQQEIIKKLEEKASRPGFTYTLRIVGVAPTEQRAKEIVDSIIPSFQIFDIKPFNWFTKKKTNSQEALENFTLRAPSLNETNIINLEEINSIWHLPNYLTQTPNIKWLLARRPSIPVFLPNPGPDTIPLGVAEARGQKRDVHIKIEDRLRHVYSLGGSGSGKSYLMTNVILEDIKKGFGVCVVDPHGETIDDVLLRIPTEREDDVIVFSPTFTDMPLGLNMLEIDPEKPQQKTVVIDTLFTIWDKLYNLKQTGGPMFENYMKNSMRLIMSHPESGNTLMEISKVLTDEDFRAFKLAMCEEDEVRQFWEQEATKAGGDASLENMVPYITSKLAPFLTNDFIRPMIGQQKSAINFREAMDNNKIILVKLEKGLIGETSAYLIGMVVIGNLLLAGMGRNDGLKYNLDGTKTEILATERPPYFVYIDEMQNFLFDAIPKALEEIRKYKVGFYLAHQFIKQVVVQGDERIKDSIMANCANKFIYRCGADDAQYLEKEFGPTLNTQDLMSPEKYTVNVIMLVDGQKTTPFNLKPNMMDPNIDVEKRKRIIANTKKRYGKPRAEVEKEIKDRSKLLF